ncbi:hypothetical protein BRADI_1g41880v3 [Brachypodium distachyon]|uniref:Uncharacterized protein n=1 Tax=Brachypodium distachyon TaxID=15368 RepID=A0A0Q3NLL5_BRADI|nr:hypothetical protein BRADI_1g41880v3 [Brachypodium distachyon]
MADESFFNRMVSQLRYYTGYPKDLGPSRIIPFTCTYTQHLDKVPEEAAATFYPHIKFVRVECPKYPGFCLTRQKTEYPFLEVFYNPEQFNYDRSVYGFREYFKKNGFKHAEIN